MCGLPIRPDAIDCDVEMRVISISMLHDRGLMVLQSKDFEGGIGI